VSRAVIQLSDDPAAPPAARPLRRHRLWNLEVSVTYVKRRGEPHGPVQWNYSNMNVETSELPDRILSLFLARQNQEDPDSYELFTISPSTFYARSPTNTVVFFHVIRAYQSPQPDTDD
jgi:hypothetical protein